MLLGSYLLAFSNSSVNFESKMLFDEDGLEFEMQLADKLLLEVLILSSSPYGYPLLGVFYSILHLDRTTKFRFFSPSFSSSLSLSSLFPLPLLLDYYYPFSSLLDSLNLAWQLKFTMLRELLILILLFTNYYYYPLKVTLLFSILLLLYFLTKLIELSFNFFYESYYYYLIPVYPTPL